MANARKQNVLIRDTTGQIDGNLKIKSIKLMSGSDAATLTMKADSTAGAVVWEMEASAANTNVFEGDLDIECPGGAYFTFTGTSPKAYVVLG